MYENFMKLITDRYSVRKFTDKVIDQETINKILAAAQVAPTACNRQPIQIMVINNEEAIAKLKKCTECHFNANTAMLVCYDKKECWERIYDGKSSGEVDASIVTTHIMLAASALGVGTTWVMYFIPEAFMTEFSIPENMEPVALLVMGYPAEDSKPAVQHGISKSLEEMVCYNQI